MEGREAIKTVFQIIAVQSERYFTKKIYNLPAERANEKRDLLLRHVSIPPDVHLPKLEPSAVIPVTMRENPSISQQTQQ